MKDERQLVGCRIYHLTCEGNGKMKNHIDLRKHLRHHAREGSVAALGNTKLGIIIDICKGGLAFRYIDFDLKDKKTVAKQSLAISIVRDVDRFYLCNVPCKIILDHYSLPGYFLSSLKMNKCSVQFGEMTSEKVLQLQYFIDNFTIGLTVKHAY